MLAGGLLLYGFLMSFVLSAGMRNKREGRTNPFILTAVGYVMCGLTAGAAIMLPAWGLLDPAGAAELANASGPVTLSF